MGNGVSGGVDCDSLPVPTSLVFAAAGASDFNLAKFVGVVAASRGFRYTAIALIVDRYGRGFIGVLRHPTQYWGWLLLFAAIVLILIGCGILFNKRLTIAATH
jgi:hypothetical protein